MHLVNTHHIINTIARVSTRAAREEAERKALQQKAQRTKAIGVIVAVCILAASGFGIYQWQKGKATENADVRPSTAQVQTSTTPSQPKVSLKPASTEDKDKTFTVNGVSFKMVRIPAGEFMMGSPPNEPERDNDETQHRVRISRDYWMGQTEVTQGLWKAVMGSNPSKFSNCGDDCPVEQVSWNDCQEFIRKLNGIVSGGNFRLPTEAEWEYACRAGTTGPYAGDLDAMGWYGKNSGDSTHPVGQKRPNAWGLYNMHGNVWEWCQDWKGDYPSGSVTDPTGPSSGSRRVIRGGSWRFGAGFCLSAARGTTPALREGFLGLRLARTN